VNRPISGWLWPRRLASVGALLVGLAISGGRAEAGEATDALRAVYTEAGRIVRAGAIDEGSLAAIQTLFGGAFDFHSAAERALGWRWQTHSATEQKDFTVLFAGLVQRGFMYWLASVASIGRGGGSLTVGYLEETVDRDQATVRTVIGRRGGGDVHLDHFMVNVSRCWMVRDVTIDGVSLVGSYRAQFDHVIRTSSYQGLIERMHEKISDDVSRVTSPRSRGLNGRPSELFEGQ
jgi:phospholipid transport system substrate-binding protein